MQRQAASLDDGRDFSRQIGTDAWNLIDLFLTQISDLRRLIANRSGGIAVALTRKKLSPATSSISAVSSRTLATS